MLPLLLLLLLPLLLLLLPLLISLLVLLLLLLQLLAPSAKNSTSVSGPNVLHEPHSLQVAT